MTKIKSWKAVTTAVGFVVGCLVLNGIAAAWTGERTGNISHVIPFAVGTTHLGNGDSITINQIRGTSEAFAAGNVYEIKGVYKLASHERAILGADVSTDIGFPTEHVAIHGMEEFQGTDKIIVDKGEGNFILLLFMADGGSPHLVFYPVSGGESFASVNVARQQYSGDEISHQVHFVVGRTQLEGADMITIDEIRGTSETIAPGNVYEIKGFYKLASKKTATLYTSVTSSVWKNVPLRGLDDSQGPRKEHIEQGEGRFTLFLYMLEEGKPHVSFSEGGHSFASIYFGNQ